MKTVCQQHAQEPRLSQQPSAPEAAVKSEDSSGIKAGGLGKHLLAREFCSHIVGLLLHQPQGIFVKE